MNATVSYELPVAVVVPANPSVNLITVSGPPGPRGIDGTGGFVLTGQYPIFYDAGSGIVGIVSGYYATFAELTGISGALVAQIGAAAAGVNSINGISGFVTLAANSPLFVYAAGQTLLISGSGLATSGDLSNLYSSIAASGQAAWSAAQNNALNLSGNLIATGSYLYNLITGASGQSSSVAGVLSLNGLTGAVNLTGAGAVTVFFNGQLVTISGLTSGGGGDITLAQFNALSGYVNSQDYATGQLSILYASGASGNLQAQINAISSSGITGTSDSRYLIKVAGQPEQFVEPRVWFNEYITTNEKGINAPSGARILFSDQDVGGDISLNVSTSFIHYRYESGAVERQWGWDSFINTFYLGDSITGQVLDLSYRILSGEWTTDTSGTSPLAVVNIARLGQVSGAINSLVLGLSGQAATDYATKTQLVITGQTLYDLIIGSSGQILNLVAQTGHQAWLAANNNGINLSGNIQSTGISLQNQINSIVAGTGQINRDVVYTSGTQLISGTKYFIGNTYIDNLFVTGTQTVVNTQDIYVGDNWLVLNATGGARDSALFMATGLTGISATGALIGWDVPSNSWRFGLGSQLTDLVTLPTIASGEAVDLVNTRVTSLSGFVISLSGGLENRIIQSGNATLVYANGIGVNLSGDITLTGQTLGNRIVSLSGFVGLVSGGLEVRIAQTGSAAVNHANGIGTILSGNLSQTGAIIQSRINSLSGWAAPFYESSITIAANYTVLGNESRIYCNNVIPITLTFPSAITASGYVGRVKVVNTGSVLFTGTAGQTFDGSPSYQVVGQYSARELHSNGSNWFMW